MAGIMARQPGSGKSQLNRILRDVHGGVAGSPFPRCRNEIIEDDDTSRFPV
jgi:hypothetical protein